MLFRSATHGETSFEVLGSGDGQAIHHRFSLKKPPLTYTTAANARGSESTLQVRVDGVLWKEASSLYGVPPSGQAYILRLQDDATTDVIFGDGTRGARLPSGQENITATYRSGMGSLGNVPKESLSILKTKPLGIAEVTNLLPATGGTDRETLQEAQQNAPPTTQNLGRIVSLHDFESFAQGYVGIGKAQARALWTGSGQFIHITIAGSNGEEVAQSSPLYQSLQQAMDMARDPSHEVAMATYQKLYFNLEARVLISPDALADVVRDMLVKRLDEYFSFSSRNFGQPVTSSEVFSILQQPAEVSAVDLDALYVDGHDRRLNHSLPALTARYSPASPSEVILPAQLLLLNRNGLKIIFVPSL